MKVSGTQLITESREYIFKSGSCRDLGVIPRRYKLIRADTKQPPNGAIETRAVVLNEINGPCMSHLLAKLLISLLLAVCNHVMLGDECCSPVPTNCR